MAVLAHAETEQIAAGSRDDRRCRRSEDLREPENGLVMVRGRVGGDGAPFNLGEATVTRAAVRLASGEIGFGYTLGRDREKARLIALCDALMQRDDFAGAIEAKVLAPLRAEHGRGASSARPRRPRRPGSTSTRWCGVRAEHDGDCRIVRRLRRQGDCRRRSTFRAVMDAMARPGTRAAHRRRAAARPGAADARRPPRSR